MDCIQPKTLVNKAWFTGEAVSSKVDFNQSCRLETLTWLLCGSIYLKLYSLEFRLDLKLHCKIIYCMSQVL